MKLAVLPVLLLAAPALAFDANGVPLGASEQAVKQGFPSAHCKPLEWKTDAADRRCDDARTSFANVPAKVTFYLRRGVVQAFDLRLDSKDLERVKSHLKSRWGAPQSETVETIARRQGDDRKVLKMRWEKGADHATLVTQLEKKRLGVEVGRGTFFEDIYKVN